MVEGEDEVHNGDRTPGNLKNRELTDTFWGYDQSCGIGGSQGRRHISA